MNDPITCRRSSAFVREDVSSVVKDLPLLRDTPLPKREALFKQKLALCSVTGFNWDDPEADRRAKEVKRLTLMELVDFVDTPTGQKLFSEAMYGDVIAMLSANIFRSLPPATISTAASNGGEEVTGISGGEGEDEEPYLEPSWAHLQLVYEFLLRFVVSGEVKVKTAKKSISNQFCARLIDMFDSEDPRERDYLKVSATRYSAYATPYRSNTYFIVLVCCCRRSCTGYTASS